MNKKTKKGIPIESEPFNYGEFEKEAISALYRGENLAGENGILTGLIQKLVNAALSGEADGHISNEKEKGVKNRRNGYTQKTLKTTYGPIEITPPRDREGTFEPQIIKKWDRKIGTGLNEQILLMYAHGNSYTDIQHQIKKIYGLAYSTATISEVTDQVYTEVANWQQRRLPSMYAVLFLDGIYFTSRENGTSQKRVIYSLYGINCEGQREVLGIYIKDSEGASHWASVLQDIKNRGVEDVLFVCVDGLTGFKDAIEAVFPQSLVQRCIVHMIRSCVKFVPNKDLRPVCKDLKLIYGASDELSAQIALESFKVKWDGKYPEISKAWQKDWTELMNFMGFSENIRKIIYTTNAVEALHRQIRKVTKTKGSWTNDKALIKQIYLILTYGKGGWKREVMSWTPIARELKEKFGERFTKHAE
jgi:putative transposase